MRSAVICVVATLAVGSAFAPGALRPTHSSVCARRAPAPAAGLFGFGRKKEASSPKQGGKRGGKQGGGLARAADHVDPSELELTGGQRRKLRTFATTKSIETVVVGDPAEDWAAVDEVRDRAERTPAHPRLAPPHAHPSSPPACCAAPRR